MIYRIMIHGRHKSLVSRLRASLQRMTGEEETPLDGDAPAWAVSLFAHVCVLVLLASAVIPSENTASFPIVMHAPSEREDVVDYTPAGSDAPISFVPQGAPEDDEVPPAPTAEPVVLSDDPVAIEEPLEIGDAQGGTPEQFSADFTDSMGVRGEVAVGTDGAGGAVDRLASEIKASLDRRPTLVVWVFDQSVSLSAQRKEIAARLDRVFDEVGADGSEPGQADLLNMVFAYGENVTPVVLRPTKDSSKVVEAIRSIPVDDSGVENTFGALADAAKAVRTGGVRRNVMIVAFTDEVGNDQQYADQVAEFCRKRSFRVYVVGVPAPFGRRQVQVRFVEFDPKYAGDDQFPVVDQGPETLYPELVRIGTDRVDEEPIDSGFGPYSLSKVCAATGGVYFCVHANRKAGVRVTETAPMASRLYRFFDSEAMRAYRPDYLLSSKVDQLISANRAKKALVEAARISEVGDMKSPRMVFPREDDGSLANLLGEAQRAAAVLSPKIDRLHGILASGQPDRDKIGANERRWLAGYDLAMGRVLAAKVRVESYNIMLANAKSGMKFKNPGSDTWKLVRSHKVSGVGSQVEKMAAQARAYLERVVGDHPGTPWAMIAQEELEMPLGYEWQEARSGVGARTEASGSSESPDEDEKKRNLAPPKPKRPLKNL